MKSAERVAIVTGAAQGIGEAIAVRLARSGVDVAVVDLNLALADTVAKRIRGDGCRSLAIS